MPIALESVRRATSFHLLGSLNAERLAYSPDSATTFLIVGINTDANSTPRMNAAISSRITPGPSAGAHPTFRASIVIHRPIQNMGRENANNESAVTAVPIQVPRLAALNNPKGTLSTNAHADARASRRTVLGTPCNTRSAGAVKLGPPPGRWNPKTM